MKFPLVVTRRVSFNGFNKVELRFTFDKPRERYFVEVIGGVSQVPGMVIQRVRPGKEVKLDSGERVSGSDKTWVAIAYDFRDHVPRTDLGCLVTGPSPRSVYKAAVAYSW